MAKLKQGYKTLLVLFFALLATLSFYFLYVVPQREKQLQASRGETQQITISPNEVQRLELKNKHGSFSFMKTDNSWHMIRPLEKEGDNFALNTIVDYFKVLKLRTVVPERATDSVLHRFGLLKPGIELTLWREDGNKLFTLYLGDLTPDRMSVYGYFDDEDGIAILPMYLIILLDKNLYDLRDKSVFTFDAENVSRVVMDFAGSGIDIEKIEERNWVFKSPVCGAADARSVEHLLNQLRWIAVAEFFNNRQPEPQSVGLDRPWARISVTETATNSSQSISFGFIDEQKGIYAQSDDTGEMFLLPIETTRFFMEDVHYLRDQSVFKFEDNDIRGFELDYPGDKDDFLVERDPRGDWIIVIPERKKADADAVEKYFKELRALESKEFLPLHLFNKTEAALLRPDFRLILERSDGKAVTLSFGLHPEENPEFIYARLNHHDEVMLLDAHIANNLQKEQRYFEFRYLYLFNIRDVYKVDLLFKGTETSVQRIKDDKWKMSSPHKRIVNRFQVLMVLRDLWRLKSDQDLSPVEMARVIEERPNIEIHLWIESVSIPVRYSFWEPYGNNHFFIVKVDEELHMVGDEKVQTLKNRLDQIYAQTM